MHERKRERKSSSPIIPKGKFISRKEEEEEEEEEEKHYSRLFKLITN